MNSIRDGGSYGVFSCDPTRLAQMASNLFQTLWPESLNGCQGKELSTGYPAHKWVCSEFQEQRSNKQPMEQWVEEF